MRQLVALGRGLAHRAGRDGKVGAEGHGGEDYLVVGRDGSVQLPPDVLDALPPGTLARAVRTEAGVEIRRADVERG